VQNNYTIITLFLDLKIRSTWKIINSEKWTNQHDMSVSSIIMNGKTITNQYEIANIFNNYFSSVADSINVDNNTAKPSSKTNPINYLYKYHGTPFTKLNWQYSSTYEIGKIINSIKFKN
jgi:hypothetical protein